MNKTNSSLSGLLLAFILLLAAPVHAQDTVGRIRADNALRCAAEPRPGFAGAADDGRITGLAVDLCRAVAIALLGPGGRVEVSLLDGESAFAPVRHSAVDVAFLSGAAIADNHLGAVLVPGPVVFIDPIAVMVPVSSAARSPSDLGGRTVCLMIGSPGQRALEAALAAAGTTVSRLAFGEDVEMLDAYNVGNCEAVVDHATRLARMRRTAGINNLQSRILAPPLALTPMLAATPVTDSAWAGLIAWTLHLLIADDGRPSPWRATAAPPLPGLRSDWLADVQAALGSYAAMRERHLGGGSPLGLPPWPNAPWPEGLLPRLTFD
jgi:general L-amino acid transport system substrate-binding protein